MIVWQNLKEYITLIMMKDINMKDLIEFQAKGNRHMVKNGTQPIFTRDGERIIGILKSEDIGSWTIDMTHLGESPEDTYRLSKSGYHKVNDKNHSKLYISLTNGRVQQGIYREIR